MPAKKLPEIIVFAGPNGSGKSTITRLAKIIEPYINADDIKRTNHCTDLEAAQMVFGSGEKSHVAPVGKSQFLTNEKNQNYPNQTSFLE